MKIRDGFVSNSSSTSFVILTKEDLELCKKYDIKTYKASDLLTLHARLDKLSDEIAEVFNSGQESMPYYMYQDMHWKFENIIDGSMLDEVKEMAIKRGSEDFYITDDVDRDWLYRQGLDD